MILCNSPAADAESVVYADCELSAAGCVSAAVVVGGWEVFHPAQQSGQWLLRTTRAVCPSTAGCGQHKPKEERKITATGILLIQPTPDIFTFHILLKKSLRNCSNCRFERQDVGLFHNGTDSHRDATGLPTLPPSGHTFNWPGTKEPP